MNDTTSASSRNTLSRRIIKRTVISLYCRGWLSMRATAWVFRNINLKDV